MPEPSPADWDDETRATAQLPTLDIEIVHRPNAANEAERLVVTMREVTADEAFGRWLEATNPFLFWLRATQMVWSVWLPVYTPARPVERRH